MTVLRSREIFPKSSPKTLKKSHAPIIEPSTPAKINEHSNHYTSLSIDLNLSPPDSNAEDLGLGLGLGSSSNQRRSLRIASKPSRTDNVNPNNENPKNADEERRKGSCYGASGYGKADSEDSGNEKGKKKTTRKPNKKARVSKARVSGSFIDCGMGEKEKEGIDGPILVMDSDEEGKDKALGFLEDKGSKEYEKSMTLRSGTRIAKRGIEEIDVLDENDEAVLESEMNPNRSKRRLSKEEKGKAKLDSVDVEFTEENLVEKEDLDWMCFMSEIMTNPHEDVIEETAWEEVRLDASNIKNEDHIERYKKYSLENAKRSASRFAHFKSEGEEEYQQYNSSVPETEMPLAENDQEIEDWPGPFSTAMKIIKDRELGLKVRGMNSTSNLSKSMPGIDWVPSKNHNCILSARVVPSLQDLCINVLYRNAEEISSLEGVPDALRNKLCQLLCDSRKMNCRILELIVGDCPSEIRLKDCSWITEEQLGSILGGCNREHLRVLQLDLCGRCISDYILRDTLARTPNSFPALTTISLRGACSLTDNGLNALITSTPLLRSINLGQCSLLTSTGIKSLVDNLGSDLRELYIDDCQSIDAMRIIPALKKLKHLEVLSVAGIETVCDKFVSELIPVCGPNMKELVFADCRNLTDASLKVVAETCSELRALDLVNLRKLTDSSIQHITNGCRLIKALKLCRNTFRENSLF
ncbi:uncharacterized protein LOC143863886 isoform X2 [Tasmannia lanceolata]|uniref:uncharacterized protein LOC143863886 isoform X2 n=1 Tax=Tasmannia lanceolata TaxID=3420 RepID=UPI004063F823